MTLLVDAGNSRIKWGILKRTRLHGQGSAARGDGPPESLFDECWGALENPGRVLAASVAGPEFNDALDRWTERHWGVTAELAIPVHQAFGVTNAYAEPERLGADRWVTLLAARERVTGPVCVVDCGTAVTIDALDGDGNHLGGLIVPGMAMMGQALLEHTRGIRSIEGGEAALLARDTAGAVRGGALYATVALIDRVCADLAAELGGVERIITGGDAGRLLPLLAGEFRHEPELVLDGLALLARDAASSKRQSGGRRRRAKKHSE